MLQVFFPVEYNISFHKEANVIPIQASLILVILLSYTYYLPLRLKIGFKAIWNEVQGFESAADIGEDIINELPV